MRVPGSAVVVAVVLCVQATAAHGGGVAPVLYVSPGGSDAGDCTRSAPCASFQRAYSLSGPGGTALVAAGSYPTQRLATDNPRATPARPVVFRGGGRVLVAQADLEGASDIVFERMTFGNGQPENRAWYQIYSSNTRCDRCVLRGQLAIDGGDRAGPRGTRNASFTNGSIGGYVANDSDPQIGGMRGPQYPDQAQPTNISFVGEVFHDIDASSQDAHAECLQVLAVHGLTIRNSRFYACNRHGNGSKASIMFSGFDAHGTNDDYWNVVLVNDMFTGGPSGSNRIALSWDNQFGFQRDCRHIVVRNSAILGSVLWGCPDRTQTLVEKTVETFQWTGAWAMNQCNAVFLNDIWGSDGHCPGTGVRSGRPLRFVDSSDTARLNLHLAKGSYGYGLGIGLR